MTKRIRPRKREGTVLFDLTVRDGNTPIIKVKEGELSTLEEVIELMKRKINR